MPLPLARSSTAEIAPFRKAACRTGSSDLPTRRQWEAPALLRGWHLTSLDAPTVAVVWSLSFARTAGIDLPLWVPVLIALGTWCVYVGDRILDAGRALKSGRVESLRERHFLHWRYRRALIPLAAIAAVVSVAIVFGQMPATIRAHDSVLALAALAYFSGVHAPGEPGSRWLSRVWPKELVVGVLFTAGCALPALTRMRIPSGNEVSVVLFLLAMSFYAALAWLNCTAIDRWESTSRTDIARTARGIAVGGFVLALVCAPISSRLSLLCVAGAGSALLLALLDRRRARLTPLALRCAADLVLLTPLLCLAR